MLHIYQVTYHFVYRKTIKIERYAGWKILSDEEKDSNIKVITWDNIANDYYNYGYMYPGNVYHNKYGRGFYLFDVPFFGKDGCLYGNGRCTQEQKEQLDLYYWVSYEQCDELYSINEILKYSNVKKAIQYLQEQGLANYPQK